MCDDQAAGSSIGAAWAVAERGSDLLPDFCAKRKLAGGLLGSIGCSWPLDDSDGTL